MYRSRRDERLSWPTFQHAVGYAVPRCAMIQLHTVRGGRKWWPPRWLLSDLLDRCSSSSSLHSDIGLCGCQSAVIKRQPAVRFQMSWRHWTIARQYSTSARPLTDIKGSTSPLPGGHLPVCPSLTNLTSLPDWKGPAELTIHQLDCRQIDFCRLMQCVGAAFAMVTWLCFCYVDVFSKRLSQSSCDSHHIVAQPF